MESMKNVLWFLVGIVGGFIVAHFVDKDPRGHELMADVDARISEFTDRIADAYRAQEARFEGIVAEVKDAAADALESAKDTAGDVVDAAKGTAGDAVDAVKDAAATAADKASDAVDAAKDAASDAADAASDAVEEAADTASDAAEKATGDDAPHND